MLKITSSIISQVNSLCLVPQYNYTSRPRKILNLHQRMKKYGSQPQKYKLKTIIRPPNLKDTSLQFPIRIPIRYRFLYKPTKQLFIDNNKQIKWQRLSPNEILLAFENFQYLSHRQIIQGLQYLSKIQGQQRHNWNGHPWINRAFDYIQKNFNKIKTLDLMKFYRLMKKLNCTNQQFWKKMYSKLEQNVYQIYPSDFEFLFLTYYKTSNQVFSPQMKGKFLKLMQGRLRQFKNSSILSIFQIYLQQQRLDTYWLENVFIPLFKHETRKFRIEQIGQIFRFMMMVGHQKNDRLYDNLYNRVKTYEYKSIEQVQLMEDIILQVKQIFTSHRVEPYLQFFKQQKQRLSQITQSKKLELYQIVKQDLIFFMQKRKLKQQVAST